MVQGGLLSWPHLGEERAVEYQQPGAPGALQPVLVALQWLGTQAAPSEWWPRWAQQQPISTARRRATISAEVAQQLSASPRVLDVRAKDIVDRIHLVVVAELPQTLEVDERLAEDRAIRRTFLTAIRGSGEEASAELSIYAETDPRPDWVGELPLLSRSR